MPRSRHASCAALGAARLPVVPNSEGREPEQFRRACSQRCRIRIPEKEERQHGGTLGHARRGRRQSVAEGVSG